MTFKYIFWDNDGVLVNTERYYFRATREVLAGVGIDLTCEEFIRISLTEGRSIFDLAKEHGISEQVIDDLRRWRNNRYAELLEHEDLDFSSAGKVLAELHGRINMAIVTSSLRIHFDIIHRRTGMLPHCDFYLTREDYGMSKPNPEPYLLALQRSGHSADSVLVIEDSPRGLISAKAAGLTCWVLPGEQTFDDDYLQADRILLELGEIPGLIL